MARQAFVHLSKDFDEVPQNSGRFGVHLHDFRSFNFVHGQPKASDEKNLSEAANQSSLTCP